MHAFIVEGVMEQKIVQRLCPDVPVRLMGIGGKDAKPTAIAKFIDVQLRTLYNKYHPINIVFDREKRQISSTQLSSEVQIALENLNYVSNIQIFISDLCIENWIYADTTIFNRLYDAAPHGYPGDGVACQKRLSDALKVLGKPYNKTTTGVDLFCQIDVSEVSNNSPSFDYMRSRLAGSCNFFK